MLGRYSGNSHGVDGADSTEYTPEAMSGALPLYEGCTVRTDHPDRRNPKATRSVNETFGQLRNCRVEGNCVRADLHYLKSHHLADSVCEDVERGLGVWGLSHNAFAGKTSVKNNRYVIEQIEEVRSVDLVDKPATNKNLWESREAPTVSVTLRDILEAVSPRLTRKKRKWADHLLEDDDPAGMMDAPAPDMVAPPDESTDPDDALKCGFRASVMAVVDQILDGETDPGEGLEEAQGLAHDARQVDGRRRARRTAGRRG